jgi:hypothetical protein
MIPDLLALATIPELNRFEYQEISTLLSREKLENKLQFAEMVLRSYRSHGYALGLFLACVLPLAQDWAFARARRLRVSDLTAEFMYNESVEGAIRMFHRFEFPDGVPFAKALRRILKSSALEVFKRKEHVSRHVSPSVPAIENQELQWSPRYDELLLSRQVFKEARALR